MERASLTPSFRKERASLTHIFRKERASLTPIGSLAAWGGSSGGLVVKVNKYSGQWELYNC